MLIHLPWLTRMVWFIGWRSFGSFSIWQNLKYIYITCMFNFFSVSNYLTDRVLMCLYVLHQSYPDIWSMMEQASLAGSPVVLAMANRFIIGREFVTCLWTFTDSSVISTCKDNM